MSCSDISPAVAVAAAGMLQGTGISVPPALKQAVTNYTTTGVVGTAQKALTAASGVVGNPLAGLGSTILPSITAVVPPGATNILSSANLNNFPGQILGQANKIMSGGIGGFAQIFGQVQGFASTSLSINQFASVANNLKIDNLGLNINSFSSMVSNGIGSIQNLGNFSNTMKNLGGLFDMTNMSSLGSPGGLMKNLLDKGVGNFGDMTGKLKDLGVPLDDLNNPKYAGQIQSVLSSVQGDELKKVFGTLDVNLNNISNLNQVLNLNNLAPPSIIGSFGPQFKSLGDIGKQFSEMGGSFASGGELAKMTKSIEVISLPRLDAPSFNGGKLIPDGIKNVFSNSFGTGSGDFGNPKISDIIGSVSGATHITSLSEAIPSIEIITASDKGQLLDKQLQLLNDIASGAYGGGGNAVLDNANLELIGTSCVIDSAVLIEAGLDGVDVGDISTTLTNMRARVESSILDIATDSDLSEQVNQLKTNYEESTTQLVREKTNLTAAGIDLTRIHSLDSSDMDIPYDSSYPNAPLTDWAADDLYRYWESLPAVNTTGNVSANLDLCRGAMYISSYLFTNGDEFAGYVDSYWDNTESNANIWIRSVYPEVNDVSFDLSSGICYFEPTNWRAVGLFEDRPLGYPVTGIPSPEETSELTSTVETPDTSQDTMTSKSLYIAAPTAAIKTSVVGSIAGNKTSILNFAKQLPEIGKDKLGLGAAAIIQGMATDNVYGDAVKAAMVEGRNKERLQAFGITPAADKIIAPESANPTPISNVQFDNISDADPLTKYPQTKKWPGFSEDYDYSISPVSSNGWITEGQGSLVVGGDDSISVGVTTPDTYGAIREFTVTLKPKNPVSQVITSKFTVTVRQQKIYIDKVNFGTITQQIPTSTIDSEVVVISGIDETEGVYLDGGDIGGNILIVDISGTILEDINPGDTGEVVGTVTNGTRLKLRAQTPNFGEERTLTLNQIVQTTGEIRPIGTWTIRNRLA